MLLLRARDLAKTGDAGGLIVEDVTLARPPRALQAGPAQTAGPDAIRLAEACGLVAAKVRGVVRAVGPPPPCVRPPCAPVVLETVSGPPGAGEAGADAAVASSVVEAAAVLAGGVQLMAGTRLLKPFHFRLFWPD